MQEKNRKISSLYKLGFYVVLGLLLGNIIKGTIFFRSTVVGDSMNPTYEDGDIVNINRLSKPERNDIVIVDLPDEGKHLIKRCVGMPGDTIQIKEGKVFVNGVELEEDYLSKENKTCDGGLANEPILLGEDEYFVLGDNRSVSKDSRYFGAVKKEQIIGVVM